MLLQLHLFVYLINFAKFSSLYMVYAIVVHCDVCVCHYLLIHQLFQRSFLCRTHLSQVNDSVCFLPESRWLSLFMRIS